MRGQLYALVILLNVVLVSAAPTLTNIDIIPSPLTPGEEVTIMYTISNNEPLRSISTDIELGPNINQHFNENTNKNTYTFTKTFNVPNTYTENTHLELLVRVVEETPIYRVIPLVLEKEEETQVFNPVGNDDIVLFVDPIRDVERGDSIYYPVVVRNQGDEEQEVILGLQDVRLWGTYRIDPDKTIKVQPQTEEVVYIYLAISEVADTGRKVFQVTAEYEGNKETADIQLAVLDIEEKDGVHGLAQLFILIGLVLIIAAIIILIIHYKGKGNEFITYY